MGQKSQANPKKIHKTLKGVKKRMTGHVLVGGGTGFIGRHLVNTLTKSGYQVTVASRTSGSGKISWDDIKNNGIPDSVNAIVNLGTVFSCYFHFHNPEYN